MLTNAYYQIWRPSGNSDTKYCTAQNFSKGFFELCAGYAEVENCLRTILTKYSQSESALEDLLNTPDPRLYSPMKHVVFELQENYKMILNANGIKCNRSISGSDFALLEKPMHLSHYACTIKLHGQEMKISPFSQLPNSLSPWYLEKITLFSSSKNYISQTNLGNFLSAVAALRCLLFAQFGPESEMAISPAKASTAKSKNAEYYPIESIFSVESPIWPKEDWYDILYQPPVLRQIIPYPLDR